MNGLLSHENVQEIPVDQLLLDKNNPRFGQLSEGRRNQTDILDFIVSTFGVDDVLSSLAVNGYFAAEPLVCRKDSNSDSYIVAEGNRRLAACLILNGDERAKNQSGLTKKFQEVHRKHGSPKVVPIPAIIIEAGANDKALLSYLGVRHIAAARAWDSYAKAVWIHRVVTESGISIEDAAAMIGDEHKTLSRLLEGYHFVGQLERADRFDPENSVRKGRGSNTQYPFSWVYTILGYNSVRRFTGISDDPTNDTPVPSEKLENASILTRAMFGDREKGVSSAITDSRQLRSLAMAVEDPEKVELLQQGKTLKEIERQTEPLEKRLSSGLVEAKEILRDLNNRLTEQDIGHGLAESFTGQSMRVKKLAQEVDRRLQEAAGNADN